MEVRTGYQSSGSYAKSMLGTGLACSVGLQFLELPTAIGFASFVAGFLLLGTA